MESQTGQLSLRELSGTRVSPADLYSVCRRVYVDRAWIPCRGVEDSNFNGRSAEDPPAASQWQ